MGKVCGSKIRFRSHESALNFIGSKFRNLRLADLHAYRCPVCAKFHIGHRKYPAMGATTTAT